MKKTTIIVVLLVIGGLIITTFVTLRLTHGVDYYIVATESNMPNLTVGSPFFASKYKTPVYNSFVCYLSKKESLPWIHRVIGKPNDVIQIKESVVYRNGVKLNEPRVWNEYVLSQQQFNSVMGYIYKNNNKVEELADGNYAVCFTDKEMVTYHLNCKKRWVPSIPHDTVMIESFRNKGYTPDNFGPVEVPPNCYFLMGDSRHNALDSRYIGFIKSEDIIATQIWN